MAQLDFLQSLIANASIVVQQTCKDWIAAVQLCFEPLIKNQIVKPSYVQGVIDNTNAHGPYYLICPNLAMPHADSKAGALGDGFSLLTLKEPVYFDTHKVSVLIGFAAKNSEVHLEVALPQIVAIFENQEVVEKCAQAQSVDEIIQIIKAIDYFKYLK
ncbi:PTS sugar transporter subunit IIAB [Spiroplasma clarkii]|uniref:Ascorbate-specific PTS system EIIA component n=1 Tax=Spiroplasma clarkii TaxID=2139 RepID=A0A1Y0L1N6_9MOLU|nr:PTS sugar transporter subunit IIA [Spiroplasma clarkii]ARU91896.1 PTS sugar transporter subunit IIAB [Spiroplasma clarkii]ATX71243.1 PTS system, ascorbate-specific IIA component [Spiroplasma clarkii]